MKWCIVFFFFFQAEDGIRDYKVTGVQTCALPISHCLQTLSSLQACGAATSQARRGGHRWRVARSCGLGQGQGKMLLELMRPLNGGVACLPRLYSSWTETGI